MIARLKEGNYVDIDFITFMEYKDDVEVLDDKGKPTGEKKRMVLFISDANPITLEDDLAESVYKAFIHHRKHSIYNFELGSKTFGKKYQGEK